MTTFTKYKTVTEEAVGSMFKLFIVTFINTAIIVLVVIIIFFFHFLFIYLLYFL